MTEITTYTVRRSRYPFASYGADNVPVVVTVRPNGSQGDLIELRLLRRRESVAIDVNELYAMLLRNKILSQRMAKVRSKRKVERKFARLTK
jgi:hypothetical protein